MAFVLTSTSPTVNVDYPVGGSAPNRADDVMLVQGLLLSWAWYVELSASTRHPANAVKNFDLNAFKVDGHFGAQTKALLRLYVKTRRSQGISAEGWVMPAHIEIVGTKKPFKLDTGSVDRSNLTDMGRLDMSQSSGFVDTARGKYARYRLQCIGWHMPSRLAASLARHRSKPHYVPPKLIDI